MFFRALLTLVLTRFSVASAGEYELSRMVYEQLEMRDINTPAVLQAMRTVERADFVPPHLRSLAYQDYPLSIGNDQTISQPYIVAFMSQAAEISPHEKCLEIGTGSGYQAAILSNLCKNVYTIEIIPELAVKAQITLTKLGYQNIMYLTGDGYKGWPEFSPFDVILVTAAAPSIPKELIKQLAIGGRMVIPVGTNYQQLLLIQKTSSDTIEKKELMPVRFVPMTGAVESLE